MPSRKERKMNWKYISIVLMALLAVSIAGNVYLYVYPPQTSLEKVSIMLDYLPIGRHAPIYAAIDQGFFERQGLSVTVLTSKGSSLTATTVDTKQVNFGIVEFGTFVQSVEKGLKIKSVCIIEDKSPVAITVWLDSAINTPKDLEGNRLIASIYARQYFLPLLFRLNDVDSEKVEFISVESAVATQEFLKGGGDAIVAYPDSSGPLIQREAEEVGKDVRYMLYKDFGLDIYGYCLTTHIDTINSDPDLIKRLLEGLSDGFKYASNHPEEVGDIIARYVSGIDKEIMVNQWQAAQEYFMASTEEYGHTDESTMLHCLDLVGDAYGEEILSEPGDLHTNEFLP